ncbi:MAG TPA: hypothetical protein VFF37_17115 [Streptomyces sp.]|uniref:hypothetical protein n=1 Tax=Streptomyces sp. NPDC002870 TaxID=3364666 RepID=UPI002D4EEC04|nr:hypothetical protein [Streptomyces sp.]
MRTTTTAALAAALLLGLTACGSDPEPPHVAACKTAMEKQFADAPEAGVDPREADPPAACAGVANETLARLTEELIDAER